MPPERAPSGSRGRIPSSSAAVPTTTVSSPEAAFDGRAVENSNTWFGIVASMPSACDSRSSGVVVADCSSFGTTMLKRVWPFSSGFQ